jgi:RNA polymerase sigma-70 factor (ECF subfamily)
MSVRRAAVVEATTPSSQKETVADNVLLERIAADDLGALGVLYDRHIHAVVRVVSRVSGSANDADDIAHATFMKVRELAPSFDGRPSARPWLIGIAVRLAQRRLRTMARFTHMLGRFAHVTRDAERVDPEKHAAGRAELAVIEEAIGKLSVAKRTVFVLVEIEGLAHDEVARELGIPQATVRTRLFHAKQELMLALGRSAR